MHVASKQKQKNKNTHLYCEVLVPEQHFCAAMFSSTSVHLGDAILDWIALEDTTLRRNTRKSPRSSSAVCCLGSNAEITHTHLFSCMCN